MKFLVSDKAVSHVRNAYEALRVGDTGSATEALKAALGDINRSNIKLSDIESEKLKKSLSKEGWDWKN